MDLNTQIKFLNRVGKSTAGRLKKLGIETVSDLIYYFPFRYEDFSSVKKISELNPDEAVTIKVKIKLLANRRSFRKKTMLTEALVEDDTGSLKVVWFNQPFLSKVLKVGEEIFLSGKLSESRIEMVSPEYEKVRKDTVHTARIVPVYHITEGVTQKQLRFLMSQVAPIFNVVEEFLPNEILLKNDFSNLASALKEIHFPESMKTADAAQRRLKFNEMFLIQLAIQSQKKELGQKEAPKLAFLEKQTKDYVVSLPFDLTLAQKKCAWEIIKDLNDEKPMNRLLEGDVGSGKTVVVSVAMLNVALNGYKTVMMAPTEILAEQHYNSFKRFFAKQNFKIILFTGSKREVNGEKIKKQGLLDVLAAGEFDIVVGTQAVIQENVRIKDLGLVLVDEQHRFGVKQRKHLLDREKNDLIPHFLSMTATPIPRSLVLTLYGDLDLSIIDQMPPGRKKIETKVIFEQDRYETYEFIRQQIGAGRQAFVICPLIDPSDKLEIKSVKQEFERLSRQIFPELKVAMMHGKLKPAEKEAIMTEFKDKKFDILVSTSVIEVGIDVPNSTIMMIEGADRFGLAQLHQFRGRVGRGQHQSYCFLFTENSAPTTMSRLKFMETCSNGFLLAEKDLELRGSGEIYGTKQSGLPDLKIASLADVDIIKLAQQEAKNILEKDELSDVLRKNLEKTKVVMHFE